MRKKVHQWKENFVLKRRASGPKYDEFSGIVEVDTGVWRGCIFVVENIPAREQSKTEPSLRPQLSVRSFVFHSPKK